MTKKRLLSVVIVCCALLAAIGSGSVVAGPADQVLGTGSYTANVKAIVCRGCGSLIKRTLEGMKEIESASVDQDAKTVEFAVKKDNTVKLSDIQAALKAAAEKMGMGADYTLSNVKAKSER